MTKNDLLQVASLPGFSVVVRMRKMAPGIDGGGRETKCLYYFILFCPTILIFIKLSD